MKKLVALVLALVMTLSLCTAAFADGETIGSILPKDFPKYNETDTSHYWTTENGNWCYTAGNVINFISSTGKTAYPPLTLTVVPSGNNWKTSDNVFNFNFTNGNLTSIVVSFPDSSGKFDLNGTYTAPKSDDTSINWETLAKGAAIAAGITVVTVGTIHTVKAIKNYKAEKAAAAEAAKLAEMPMVAMGDSGDAVTTLQTELNAQGYACGEVDGVFGQNTLNAVIAFQTANGLDADGVVGAQTWGALL